METWCPCTRLQSLTSSENWNVEPSFLVSFFYLRQESGQSPLRSFSPVCLCLSASSPSLVLFLSLRGMLARTQSEPIAVFAKIKPWPHPQSSRRWLDGSADLMLLLCFSSVSFKKEEREKAMLGAQLHLWCMDRLGAPPDHADGKCVP